MRSPLMTDRRAAAQTASLSARIGGARIRARVRVTPAGLLAIGGLVAAILWSVPPIILAARRR